MENRSTSEEHFSIPLEFERSNDMTSKVFCPTIDEPVAIIITKSGWSEPTYHVIIEYGDMSTSDYRFMTEDQIKESFGISSNVLKEKTSIIFTKDMSNELPNDQELGRSLRKKLNQ